MIGADMELVYLWVEEYKNIHKQGFNFSPRFYCEYNPDDNNLTICDKKKKECKDNDYIENFFGDNINVTAIVGKNGSGKSSLLEIINILTNNQVNQKLNCNYVLIFNNGKYISNINNLKSDFLNEQVEYKDIYTFGFFSETSLEKKHLERDIDISTEKIIELLQSVNIFNIPIKSSKVFTFIPKILIYDVLPEETLLKKVKNKFCELIDTEMEYQKFIDFLQEIKNYDNEIQFILSKILQEDTLSWLDNFDFDEYILNHSDEFEIFISNSILKVIEFQNISEIQWHFLIKHKHILKFEFIDHKGLKYRDLSHGEKTIFSLFLHITRIIDDYIGRKHCLTLLDEIDIPLHPNWQKSLIESIRSIAIRQDFIHYIITTHSPFLLSDIPKQNIIFLDTYKEDDKEVVEGKQKVGNCKVVDGLNEKKETFGANIHTLLSDSFFMEDGLMGEFAKGKIDKAITLLNQEHLSDEDLKYCEQIISIIGEPIVKNQLQRMLDSKRLKKIDEIDAIRSSMEAMQKRLDELEK